MIAELNALANLWWQWMVSMSWQASMFIVVISVIDRSIRRWAWPQLRYTLWLLVLLKLVIPPSWSLSGSAMSFLYPYVEGPIAVIEQKEPVASDISRRMHSDMPGESSAEAKTHTPVKTLQETQVDEVKPSLTWKAYIAGLWLAGVLILILLLLVKMSRLRKWHQQFKENERIPQWFIDLMVETCKRLNLMRLPAIVFSDKAVTPAVYGLFRPVMLLPANYLDDLSKKEAEHVLIHELSHLKRGDLWLHGLCLLLQIVYWFNPLMIWVRREMNHVREICCDLTVANILREKTNQYRQTLLNTARELLTESVEPGLGLLGIFEEPFRLVSRLKWLEKKTWRSRGLVMFSSALVSVFVILGFMPMAGVERASTNDSGTSLRSEEGIEIIDSRDMSSQLGGIEQIGKSWIEDTSQTPRPDSGYPEMNIRTRYEGPGRTIILPMTGPYNQYPDALERLRSYIRSNNIPTTNRMFCIYYSNPRETSPDDYYWELGAAIESDPEISVEPPFFVRDSEGVYVSSTVIESSPGKIGESLWWVFIAKSVWEGNIPIGPPVEFWEENPHEDNTTSDWTEMMFAIIPPEESEHDDGTCQ
jgi:beta-lactamase regulating signal transducer with metallopeptidase domain